MNKLMVPMRYARAPGDGRGGMEWARLTAADRGADLQWLVETGGDHDADRMAEAVGRRLGAAVSGSPVWAQHPDTGAFCHMIAIRAQAGQAAEMRALAATDQAIHITGAECKIYR